MGNIQLKELCRLIRQGQVSKVTLTSGGRDRHGFSCSFTPVDYDVEVDGLPPRVVDNRGREEGFSLDFWIQEIAAAAGDIVTGEVTGGVRCTTVTIPGLDRIAKSAA